jgi:hypothetical protein
MLGETTASEKFVQPQRICFICRRPFDVRTWLLVVAVVCFAIGYGLLYLHRGWIPHDDGAFGQAAERVMHGELPHRDFRDIYTGGIPLLNALAFRVFETSLSTLRYPVFAFFVLWVPAIFLIARRFVSDYASALITILAIVTSFPNYSAAVPSWYNLFLATFGTLAVIRYSESDRHLWVFVAGMMGGFSFLCKIAGLYFVAAVLLYLIYREQERDRTSGPCKLTVYSLFLCTGCLSFLLVLVRLIYAVLSAREVIHFVVPGALLVTLLLAREFSGAHGGDATRFRKLFAPGATFLAGVMTPIVFFLIPYFRSGAAHSVWEGVFILPRRRLESASLVPRDLNWPNVLAAAGLFALLIVGACLLKPLPRILRIVVPICFGLALWAAGDQSVVYRLVWNSMVLIVPLTVGATVWILWRFRLQPGNREQLFLLASVLSVCSLVQFPFSGPIYLLFILPLAPVVWAAVSSVRPTPSRYLLWTTATAYITFFVLWVTPTYIIYMGIGASPDAYVEPMKLARAKGIKVLPAHAVVYERAITLLQEHGRGDYIYAGPDCPELYFLSAKRNPTGTLFEFLDDQAGDPQRVLAILDEHAVTAVAIDLDPEFSRSPSNKLPEMLREHYPYSETVGKFEIRWRDGVRN